MSTVAIFVPTFLLLQSIRIIAIEPGATLMHAIVIHCVPYLIGESYTSINDGHSDWTIAFLFREDPMDFVLDVLHVLIRKILKGMALAEFTSI